MRRWSLVSLLAVLFLAAACDQIPFSVSIPIVLTHLQLTAQDTTQTQVFQQKTVDVAQYGSFSQYIDFARQVTVDSALLKVTNTTGAVTLELRVSEDSTLTPETLDQAHLLAALTVPAETTRRFTGTEFLNPEGLEILQEQLIPDGFFSLYFWAVTQGDSIDLMVDSLVFYVHLEGAK